MTTAAYITEEAGLFGRALTLAERDNMRKRFGKIRFDGIQKFYPIPENLVLPYRHNQLSFEFAAIETSRPFLVKYQYMLEGYDQDWNPVTSRQMPVLATSTKGLILSNSKHRLPMEFGQSR